MKKLLLSLLLAPFLFTACKKDSKDGGTGGKSALEDANWKITAATATVMGIDQDLYASGAIQDCMKDNTYTFNSDGTGTVEEGSTKCVSTDEQTRTGGSWELSSDNKQLTLSDFGDIIDLPMTTGGDLVLDVVQLDASKLKVKFTTDLGGFSTTVTITFTDQN